MMRNYQVKYGGAIEAGTIAELSVGAKVIAKPIIDGWKATVVGIGFDTNGHTYGEALDGCIAKFKKDISRRIKNGEALPKGLRTDFRVFMFEDED